MTVLKEDPLSLFLGLTDKLLRFDTLTLTKRYTLDFVVILHFFGKFVETRDRVGSLGEDENDRRLAIAIMIDSVHGHRLILDIHLAELTVHIICECERQFLWTEDFENQKLLERIQRLMQRFRQRLILRLCRNTVVLPSRHIV
jgi:hypothetical protein